MRGGRREILEKSSSVVGLFLFVDGFWGLVFLFIGLWFLFCFLGERKLLLVCGCKNFFLVVFRFVVFLRGGELFWDC